jgi:WD40 repeat protein
MRTAVTAVIVFLGSWLKQHKMKCRSAILAAPLLLVPGISHGQSHPLKFIRQIGVQWMDYYELSERHKWGWMSFVSFSPDGTMIASDGPTAPDDVSHNLVFWSFPAGKLIKSLPVAAILSRDWKYYADHDGIKEMETGKALIPLGDNVYAFFGPDSRYIAELLPEKGIHDFHIRVVELATGKKASAFERLSPFSVAISPDGVTLASGHWNVVTLWSMHTGRRVAVLHGFGRYVEALSFSKDGKLLAAGTDFGGLQIWDVDRRVRLQSLEIEGLQVSEPAFSPDGRLVAVGVYGTGAVWLIDVGTGKILDNQRVSEFGCGSVAFSPDGRFLITPSTGGLIKWPYDRGGTIRVFEVGAH